jgi:NADH-quinone oxidoreductase subunit A
MNTANSPIEYLPIIITVMVAGGFVSLTMVATHVLGPKRKSKIKDDVFECGIEAQGNARTPFSIKYFLAAILFVLFDVEVIFMYPWAVDLRNLSTLGFMEMISYLAVVFLGFLYILKKGALNWDVD